VPLIIFVGDCHYQINKMYLFLLEWQKRTGHTIDAIVHVGDFGVDLQGRDWMGIWCRMSVPILTYVCIGNHENIDSVIRWQNEPDRIKNLHLLPDGGMTTVCGVEIGSVWGNYSPKSWMHPERVRELRAKHPQHHLKATHILKDSVDNLLDYEGKMDVLITHDCATIAPPKGFSGRTIDPKIAPLLGLDPDEKVPPGCPGFTQLLEKFKPAYYFYGHFHVRDNRELGVTKVVCLNAFDFNPNEAIEVVEFRR
jgi:predicted phosphodiesterase